jgi:hypothetical protein
MVVHVVKTAVSAALRTMYASQIKHHLAFEESNSSVVVVLVAQANTNTVFWFLLSKQKLLVRNPRCAATHLTALARARGTKEPAVPTKRAFVVHRVEFVFLHGATNLEAPWTTFVAILWLPFLMSHHTLFLTPSVAVCTKARIIRTNQAITRTNQAIIRTNQAITRTSPAITLMNPLITRARMSQAIITRTSQAIIHTNQAITRDHKRARCRHLTPVCRVRSTQNRVTTKALILATAVTSTSIARDPSRARIILIPVIPLTLARPTLAPVSLALRTPLTLARPILLA